MENKFAKSHYKEKKLNSAASLITPADISAYVRTQSNTS